MLLYANSAPRNGPFECRRAMLLVSIVTLSGVPVSGTDQRPLDGASGSVGETLDGRGVDADVPARALGLDDVRTRWREEGVTLSAFSRMLHGLVVSVSLGSSDESIESSRPRAMAVRAGLFWNRLLSKGLGSSGRLLQGLLFKVPDTGDDSSCLSERPDRAALDVVSSRSVDAAKAPPLGLESSPREIDRAGLGFESSRGRSPSGGRRAPNSGNTGRVSTRTSASVLGVPNHPSSRTLIPCG